MHNSSQTQSPVRKPRIPNRKCSSALIAGVFLISGCNQQHRKEPSELHTTMAPRAVAPAPRFPILHRGRIGFIDSTGKEVINAQFDEAEQFSEGLGTVRKNKKWGVVDPGGHMAVSYQFDQALQFHEGLCPVSLHDKWGYIDNSGKLVINPQFDSSLEFSEDLAAVKLGDKWGFINKAGKLTINPQFELPTIDNNEASLAFHEALCPVPESSGDNNGGDVRYGYIDHSGKWAITAQFDSALDFGEGLAPVQTGNRWGYINKSGTFVINPQFDGADTFNCDRALVKLGDRYGYVGLDGKYQINPQFDFGQSFSEGLAAVKQGNRWGYVSPDGSFAINPQFDQASSFKNGLAVVGLNKQLGYIDKAGKFVWGPESIASLYRAETPARPKPIPPTAPKTEPSSKQFMDASQWRYLTNDDLENKSAWELTIIRNEIFARHGLIFRRNDIQAYFNNQAWYRPQTPNAEAVQATLNQYEVRNSVFVRDYAAAHGLL